MSTPTPAPRTLLGESKKPIPTPRTRTSITQKPPSPDGKNNTFSRRVRTASKQIAEDINERVQKVVIESTRESVRRITRRFTGSFNEEEIPQPKAESSSSNSSECNMFSSIRFNSPIQKSDENFYTSIDEPMYENSVMSEEDCQPPPPYPPPVLQEEMYDKPQSLASGSTTSSENIFTTKHKYDYDSVFPPYPYNSDSESCVDMTAGTIDRNVTTSRSQSFNYYDPVPKQETIHDKQEEEEANGKVAEVLSNASFIRSNSVYENYVIGGPNNTVTHSLLLEFDPLVENNNQIQKTHAETLKELEEILSPSSYTEFDNASCFEGSSEDGDEIYISPPPPPTRIDSLPEDSVEHTGESPITPTLSPAETNHKSKTNWFTPNDSISKSNESKTKKWLKHVNDVLKKAPEFVKVNRGKNNIIQRPMLLPKGIIMQKGMLYKITKGPVEEIFGEFGSRWCTIQGGSFLCYSDNTCETIKENFPMDTIMSIQIMQDQKFKYRCENDELHCFELNIAGNSRSGHVYGSKNSSERRIWMQKLVESLTGRFSASITSDYSRMGWAYIREGLSGQWMGAWIVLAKRKLIYAIDKNPIKSLDLRKARCFALEPLQTHGNSPTTTDKGPNMVIHFTSGTFYFRMWTQRETKIWCHIVKLAAKNNGPKLEEQQLTRNDVPVIVEKCINFVYAYGSMEEGIYRKSGSQSTVAELIQQFSVDAWAVQLTNKYRHHDVASTLKRFFRDISEPLIDSTKQQYLYQVSLVKSKDERIRMYKAAIDQFTSIASNTLRALLRHLYFISTQSSKNLMTVDNLAAVWGPTLLHSEAQKGDENCNKTHAIVSQLIELYKYIFPEDEKELEQERKMLSVLKKCSQVAPGTLNTQSSGDFRVWVYLFNKEGRTFNISIGPQRTAYEVLCELSPKANIPVHELILEEIVMNSNLGRPIHHTEKVLDVVLKWGYWDESDRKDNCLMLNNISKYWEYINENTLPLTAELRYADNKSKQLKPTMFEFLQAKLNCYKDKACNNLQSSWNIEDIMWYFGHETKRSPPTKYTVTFIEKKNHPKRTKSTPWFGHVICWADPTLRALWLAAMWRAEHPNNLTPPPQLVNLMAS